MTASKIKLPFTLVFSTQGKLVSFSEAVFDFLKIGMQFSDVFESGKISFTKFFENPGDLPENLQFNNLHLLFSYTYHLMKTPTNEVLALIITIISNESEKAYTAIDERIIRMDRLAQVGQLAASIAHEIRNPLAGINANIQVLADMLSDDEKYLKFFDVILEEVGRVEKIIKDLLDYSKQSKPVLTPVSPANIFEHVNTLVSSQLNKHRVKLKLETEGFTSTIKADFGQLTQIFLNCIMNASQAMPEGGVITVFFKEHPENNVFKIIFSDTGIGIPNDIKEKIFDPFFTTKAKGLGLGLSVIKKIMEDHEGKIEVESEEGKGTNISLVFPMKDVL
ncbi:MAG: signal transduction histidine kinase, nitrogen specific, NtrB [uncultured bacterium]|nr:MAG: signal transduction histidine kinase, nitrogen specific, NtrB [uncultured bacterium]